MGHLVGDEVVQHERRRQHEAPGKAQRAFRRAGPPPAPRVPHRDAAMRLAERQRMDANPRFKLAARFPPHEAEQPRANLVLGAEHLEYRKRLGRARGTEHDRGGAPRRHGSMDDQVVHAAHRQQGPGRDKDGAGKSSQPRPDPFGMPFGKDLRGSHRGAQRHGQNGVTSGGADPQREPACRADALDRDPIHHPGIDHFKRTRLLPAPGAPKIKKPAHGNGSPLDRRAARPLGNLMLPSAHSAATGTAASRSTCCVKATMRGAISRRNREPLNTP